MGDALGAIFGSGQNTDTSSQPTGSSAELNNLRLQQLQQLFSTNNLSNFATDMSGTGAFNQSPAVANLMQGVNNPDLSNLMSFNDYRDLGLNASSNYINRIATPQINSTMALQGLEGGGAAPEAIANATAQSALPFIQSLPGASTALTMAGPQARALNAQTAASMFPIADQPRALAERNILRQQGIMETGLTGLPFTPSTTGTSDRSSQPLFNWFGQG